MIPRRISFFWHGRMSWMRFLTLQTFRRHNPDWEIHLYHPAGDVYGYSANPIGFANTELESL